MYIFKDGGYTYGRLDYNLLSNSPINLYYQRKYFDADIDELKKLGYKVALFDSNQWNNEYDVYFDFSDKLGIQKAGGLDGFNDWMKDIVTTGEETGLVIAISNAEKFLKELPKYYTLHFLDILVRHTRSYMLQAYPIIILLQSNINNVEIYNLGRISVEWNHEERMYASRGLNKDAEFEEYNYMDLNDEDFKEYADWRIKTRQE